MNRKMSKYLILLFSIYLLPSAFYLLPVVHASLPKGFEVYFNNPTGTQDANAPGFDFRFKNFIDAASSTTIYAAFYSINNSTVIAALNAALRRGNTVYFICDADHTTLDNFNLLVSTRKIRTTAGFEVHNKFAVIKDSSVWTGSWNPTITDTYQNHNNVIVVRSSAMAKIFENEFLEMYSGRFGPAKTLTANNGHTVRVNDVNVKIYFSPYRSPHETNWVISDKILNAKEKVAFCLFSFTTADNRMYTSLIESIGRRIEVYGVFDITQAAYNSSTYARLRDAGAYVVFYANPVNINFNLHHKFAVIDPFTADARVITGSHNWSEGANNQNDENTLVIHSPEIARVYYEEFQRLYRKAGLIISPTKKSIDKIVIYPSPAVLKTKIGYEISSSVKETRIKIYNLSGELVRTLNPTNVPGFYNETEWDLRNSQGQRVAPGLYFVKVEATIPDGTFFETKKMTVVK